MCRYTIDKKNEGQRKEGRVGQGERCVKEGYTSSTIISITAIIINIPLRLKYMKKSLLLHALDFLILLDFNYIKTSSLFSNFSPNTLFPSLFLSLLFLIAMQHYNFCHCPSCCERNENRLFNKIVFQNSLPVPKCICKL